MMHPSATRPFAFFLFIMQTSLMCIYSILLAVREKKYSHKALISATLITIFTVLFPLQGVASDDRQSVLVLGDSLSAAYGIQIEQGWVALLQDKYKQEIIVHNASISGETTGGGLEALPRHLTNHNPDIVILELGANDGLRGFPTELIKQNLRQMIQLSKNNGAKIVLVGMHIPPNYGASYTAAFHSNYTSLATETDAALVPFLLENIALNPDLMQDDGLHPTAEAQPLILETILETLRPLLSNS